ncbi:MAG: Cell division protein FtsA, partial [candidate division CPR2 bacterium GW2011_GWD1_39_7]
KGDWWKNLPFAKKPKIKFMEPEDVANMLDNTNMMKSVQDITPMALGNLLLDYEEDESISGILKKVVKVMQV